MMRPIPKEALFPKNVGLLFFNPEPERFFPATQIDVVWFPEGAGGNRFTEKTFKGPLARMTREALDYIRRNYISETVIKHPDRAEATRVENFPYAAIEEAVVNAAYHRGYDVREPVEVRISKDELVVLSYPGPDRSVRLEDLRAGRALPRRYRNRRIGEFLKELDMTEGRSTGIPIILHTMQENGSPPPVFDFDEDHTYFMCRLPVHPQATMPEGLLAQTGLVDGGAKGGANGGAKSGAHKLTKRQAEVLSFMRENPGIAYREIAKAMEINESAVLKHIQNLKKAGALERVGSARGGHWEVRQ
jgi:ATP-dependent DNA helicase RecG